MKQLITTLNESRKSNPTEFWGGVVYCTALFTATFIMLWVVNVI